MSVESSRALRGCCPRCGQGPLFASWLEFTERCSECGLVFGDLDTGDGGAYLTICLIGGAVTAAATVVEVIFSPPYWFHLMLWLPMIVIASLLTLHYTKAWMLAAAYRHGDEA